MTYESLQASPQYLLLKCISGSNAYNLQVPNSDTDYKGIYILPQPEFFGLHYTPQVSNSTNDETYFEIGRFMELLVTNNPNILELLATPAHTTIFKHPLMHRIQASDFLSMRCLDTFAGYAKMQIKKAYGLNKQIHNPQPVDRKTPLQFCFVVEGHRSMPVEEWLQVRNLKQEDCGLSTLPNFRETYNLFHKSQFEEPVHFSGIIAKDNSNAVSLSSIPKGATPLTYLQFNKDAYTIHCKQYLQYWEWVDKRNEARFENTLQHGKNYDSKNMMHTFRLLQMAEEIALEKKIQVYRHDRDFFLSIRSGAFEYDTLLQMAEEKLARLPALYEQSGLPDAPNEAVAEALLQEIRTSFYQTLSQ
ncbi:putative nucleotidyltransferase [Chitinophaga skermanii]|uniref:Putative nucleotidyltransferase n=1 Tax=Chitinophaga skermanii TaxID=331697 RepID=A0A327QPW7_9BACT|nr:nucleotidyltransferase domain-containing protein [Chitinophaga skermanii]RAJ05393.1 putative nucleotidyltransferase [Chitinophaga skermanii]